MSTCLIALGSNLGDRAATLEAAIVDLDALAGVTLERRSRWYPMAAVGGGDGRHEFLNGAALCETSCSPREMLDALQAIEARRGRERTERWADRTLDLDLLLYDELVLDGPGLALPHPRMSFRRFVLEPAAEIAGTLVHPTIGWTLDELLQHLDAGADWVAIVSPDKRCRRQLCECLMRKFPASLLGPRPVDEIGDLWPSELTTRVSIRTSSVVDLSTIRSNHPKLTILLDPEITGPAEQIERWSAICLQPGRGPTLRITQMTAADMSAEAIAAVQAVWPALGPASGKRLE